MKKSIHIQVSENAYKKLMKFIGSFNSDEIEIVSTKTHHYQETKKDLEDSLARIDNGDATFLTLEEVDAKLEKTIQKNENNT